MEKPCKRKREDPLSTGPRSSYAVGCRVGTTANGAGAALMALFLPGAFPTPTGLPSNPCPPAVLRGPHAHQEPGRNPPRASSNLRDGPRGLHGLKYAQIARAHLVLATRRHLAVAGFARTHFIQASAWRLRSTPLWNSTAGQKCA